MRKLFTILFVLATFLLLAPLSFAQTELEICPQATEDLNFNSLCSLNAGNALPTVLSFILIVAIIIALLYLIWGGIKWITSGGDKANVEAARNQIIAAIIGLVLVFSAWFIMNFVLQTFFGGNLTGGISLPELPGLPHVPTPTPSPEAAPTTELPPCPTAYPPDYGCQLLPETIK